MKSLLVAGLLLGTAVWAAGADSFTGQLTAEERAAAGLGDLTPSQAAALDQLAERFAREGARHAVVAARDEARQEAKAEARAQVEQEVKQREESKFGLFGTKGHAEEIHSRLKGTFKGWGGRTLFSLENGQQWVQADPSDTYWVPPRTGPEVAIRQSGIGGWKLYLLPNGPWVRVKRVN